MKKYCIVCSKEIPAEYNSQKYCSKKCMNFKHNEEHKKKLTPASGMYKCKYCGKEFYYKHGQSNYGSIGCKVKPYEFCCYECGVKYRSDKFRCGYSVKAKQQMVKKVKATKLKRYSNANYNNINKIKSTCFKKYGTESISCLREIREKVKYTKLKRYGDANYNNSGKASETYYDKTGYSNPSQNPEIKSKKRKTMHKNNSFIHSVNEMKILNILKQIFPDIKYQYKSEKYPFNCDFYIPKLDLYIEYQGAWMHGKQNENKVYGPYNKDNIIHQQILDKWKTQTSKGSSQYKSAIKVWTQLDPLKREIARKNKLNWIEFFTLDEFEKWLQAYLANCQ